MLRNCRIDESWSLKIALQEAVLNHLELLYPKDRVVSVKEKTELDSVRYGVERGTQVNHRGSLENGGRCQNQEPTSILRKV